MARRIALAMALVAGCSGSDVDVKGEESPAEHLDEMPTTTEATPTTEASTSTTTTVPPTVATTTTIPALVTVAPVSTAPPSPQSLPVAGGVVDDAFWRRLADCECASGRCGGAHIGWFQFSADTAAKVGIDGSESYEEQRAAAIVWAARIHPRENTRSGWPHCWDEAA